MSVLALLLVVRPPGAVPAAAPEAPAPVYSVTGPDAVTADNQARRCPGGTPCVLPDRNPSAGAGFPVDSYTADVYERPVAPTGTPSPAVDVVSARVGNDAEWLYFRIDLFGPATGGLPHTYGFEIDYDDDPGGEVLVVVDDPSRHVGPRFGVAGVRAFWNENSNVFGATAGFPDGPGGAADGYEVAVFDHGSNQAPGRAGGADAVLARVAPPSSVEVAVRRALIEAVKRNPAGVDVSGGVDELGLRPLASSAPLDPRGFSLHDRFGRRDAGSPFPFLGDEPGVASCPETDVGLGEPIRAALDTGTDEDTGILNPCYPPGAIAELDSAFFTTATYEPPETTVPPPPRDGAAGEPEPAPPEASPWVVGSVVAAAVVVALAGLRRARRRLG